MPGIYSTLSPQNPLGIEFEENKRGKIFWVLSLFACLFLGAFFLLRPQTKLIDLPDKHPDFIGRVEELQLLKKKIKQSRAIALCGEGGIGKTETAISFAHDFQDMFSLICWIDGHSEDTISYSYARLADVLQIKESNPQKLKVQVHEALEKAKGKPWLLIFDDAYEVPNIPSNKGKILLTCRDKGLVAPENAIELEKNPADAIALLTNIIREKQSPEITQLVSQLDHLPFLVNLIGHYLSETPGVEMPEFSKIIGELLREKNGFLQTPELRKRYPRSLAKTYLITLDRLREKMPLSVQFLRSIIPLFPKNIPLEYLDIWLRKQGYPLERRFLLRGEILRELKNHAIARINDQNKELSIHDLFHKALCLEFPKMDQLDQSLEIFLELTPIQNYNPTYLESILPFQKLLGQITTLLHSEIQKSLPAAQLASILARYYMDTEYEMDKAKETLVLAQNLTENFNHPIQGRIFFQQGQLEYRKKEYQLALQNFENAYALFNELNDENDYIGLEQNRAKCKQAYQKAICLEYLAQIHRSLGNWYLARQNLEVSLQLFLDFSEGKDHFDIARILREQALLCSAQGKKEEALDKMLEAIAMQKRVYGNKYQLQPTAAATLVALGDLYLSWNNFAQADLAYEQALIINRKIYQSEAHPYVVRLQNKRKQLSEALGKHRNRQCLEGEKPNF